MTNRNAGGISDGADTDNNCTDFVGTPSSLLPVGSPAGSGTISVASVYGFHPGDSVNRLKIESPNRKPVCH